MLKQRKPKSKATETKSSDGDNEIDELIASEMEYQEQQNQRQHVSPQQSVEGPQGSGHGVQNGQQAYSNEHWQAQPSIIPATSLGKPYLGQPTQGYQGQPQHYNQPGQMQPYGHQPQYQHQYSNQPVAYPNPVPQPSTNYNIFTVQTGQPNAVVITSDQRNGELNVNEVLAAVNAYNRLRNDSTYHGRLVLFVTANPSQRISYKDNRMHVTNGFPVAHMSRKPPIPRKFDLVFAFIGLGLLIINLIFAMVDMGLEPAHLDFKLACFIFSVVELIVTIVVLVMELKGKIHMVPAYLEYLHNVAEELFMYSAIICSVVGISSEKAYLFENDMANTTMVLVMFDGLYLLGVYAIRAKFFLSMFSFLEVMMNKFEDDERFQAEKCLGSISPGLIIVRMWVTLVGNFMMSILLIMMLAIQIRDDNKKDSDYTVSGSAQYIIFCLITIPFYSLALFLMTNSYWFLELFTKVNVACGRDESFMREIEEEYGSVEKFKEKIETLQFFIRKPDHVSRLDDIIGCTTLKKFLYGLTEWWMIILIVIWGCFVNAAHAVFTGDSNRDANDTFSSNVATAYLIVSIFANAHLYLLFIILVTIIAIVTTLVITYCICVIACSKKNKD